MIGLAAAPWAMVAAAVGTLGFGFTISVEKKDGSEVDVYEDDVEISDAEWNED